MATDSNDTTALIGKPLDRIDGPLKVTGRAPYSYEYLHAKQTTYGYIVPSTIAVGSIVNIDTSAAEQAPGVLRVLTYKNMPPQAPPHPRVSDIRFERAEPYLFSAQVRYFGEPVALIVAESFETARHAANLLRVEYQPRANPAFDLAANQSQGYKPQKVNAGMATDTREGDFDTAFAQAPVKTDATYIVPYEHNMPMEPHATQAVWQGDELTLYSPQQGPEWCQSTVAKTLQMPKDKVRVITPYIGGGFGAKVPTHAQCILAALGAKVVGRPLKVAQTRQQMFANTNHRPKGIQRMRLGAQRDGALTAIAHDAWMQTTPYDEFVEQAAAFSRVMYAAPNRLHRHWGVALDLPASDIMRAPGEEPGSVAMECGIDELAVALDMDPIELRIKNEPKVDVETQLPFSSRNLVPCLREGAQRFGWQRRPSKPGTLRDDRLMIGYGVAGAMFPARTRPASCALHVAADGIVTIRMAASDLGTGSFTILAQIASERLGIPMEQIRVELGDSALPSATVSGGSMAASSNGSAVLLACDELLKRTRERGHSESLTDFVQRTAPQGLDVNATYQGSPSKPHHASYTFGAQFAEVAVDIDTCEIRVRRMLGVFAAGRVLNAKTARSQLIGSMIMGMGAALSEESLLDTRYGVFINHDLAEYHVPVNADVAEIDAIFIPERDEHINPLGSKGLGEVGIVGAAAAIANAVFNATGVRVRELPITLDKVLRGLSV